MDSSKRLPIVYGLQSVIDKRVNDAFQNFGKFYPCHIIEINKPNGSNSVPIVKVQFDITDEKGITILPSVVMPIASSEYVRLPIRVGDYGLAISADVTIGKITGLGSFGATLTEAGNLSAMVFLPVGNVNWTAFDSNSLILYSVSNGALIAISTDTITLQENGKKIVLSSSGVAITGNVTINGSLTVTGDVVGNGISLDNHKHSGVTIGSGQTGGPI